MTTFLWTIVILMAAALLAEIVAFAGMALVAMRAGRRAKEIAQQFSQTVEPTVRMVEELKQFLQPHVDTIGRDGREIAALVATRSQSIQAALDDTGRRAQRIRLRLMEGVQTVEGQQRGGRGIYREVVEPLQTASQVVRGLKLALWILRRVA
jgi:hypothetical protein